MGHPMSDLLEDHNLMSNINDNTIKITTALYEISYSEYHPIY